MIICIIWVVSIYDNTDNIINHISSQLDVKFTTIVNCVKFNYTIILLQLMMKVY